MRGSIVKRGKKYSIVIYLGRDKNGKKRQKWISGFKTKKEAEKELNNIVAEIQNNGYINIEKIKVKEYLKNWLETYVDVNLEKTTIESYRLNIEKRIIPYIGDIELQKLTPYHIQIMYNELLIKGRQDGKGGLSTKTVNQTHRVLKKALGQAVKLQLINKNVADFVEVPKKKKYYAKVLEEKEISKLLKVFKDTDIYIPVVLALGVGLRRGEVLGLRWQDIDFKNKTITINQTLLHARKGHIFSTPKTEKSRRTIVISDNIINLLIERKEEQEKYKEMLGEGYQDFDLVTCNKDGTPINPSTFSHKFSNILKQNELPNIRFHDLRHTNATLMLKNNIPAKIASERLGHSSIGITLDLYSHVTKEMQEEVANKLDKVLFKFD